MKKKLYLSILGMIIFLSMFTLVSAQPPFQQSTIVSTGIDIETPIIEYLEVGEDFEFHLHAHNASNGLHLTNSTTSCIAHIYSGNAGGHHIIEAVMEFDENLFDFEVEVDGGNFSEEGQYAVLLYCEVTGQIGGFFEYGFEVTETGSEFTIPEAILYGFILILLATFLYFALYGIRNAVSSEWLIGYICLSYIVLYLVLSVIWILSKNYLWTFPMLENVLFMAWFIMGIGFLPFVFVISLYILGKEAKASLEEDYVKQGYSREEARELSRKNKRS